MNLKKLFILLVAGMLVAGLLSCSKFLEAKSDQKLATPSTLRDLQALLDNSYVLNSGPGLPLTASDEYYLTYAAWNGQTTVADKDAYIWKDNSELNSEWNTLYHGVLYTNTVLDNGENIPAGGRQAEWNAVRGAALFFRAHLSYGLAQVFAPSYDAATAAAEAGLPLRLSADYHPRSVRATVQQTYEQLVRDLQAAAALLPETPKNRLRPSRPAAYALLARVYLQMGDYGKAWAAADSCLRLYNALIDFNTLSPSASIPLGAYNSEVIFHSVALFSGTTYYGMANIDTVLYRSYSANDLRRTIYFAGTGPWHFKGNYNSDPYSLFNGLATDEVYLVRAESAARLGNTAAALEDLNALLRKRWKTGTFTPLSAATADEALLLVLRERKKELVMRGTRWSDLRRLNREARFARPLTRLLNSEVYTLPPNDPRYTFLIPQKIINLTGMSQNPR